MTNYSDLSISSNQKGSEKKTTNLLWWYRCIGATRIRKILNKKKGMTEIQILKSAIKQLSFQRGNNRMVCGWMWNGKNDTPRIVQMDGGRRAFVIKWEVDVSFKSERISAVSVEIRTLQPLLLHSDWAQAFGHDAREAFLWGGLSGHVQLEGTFQAKPVHGKWIQIPSTHKRLRRLTQWQTPKISYDFIFKHCTM